MRKQTLLILAVLTSTVAVSCEDPCMSTDTLQYAEAIRNHQQCQDLLGHDIQEFPGEPPISTDCNQCTLQLFDNGGLTEDNCQVFLQCVDTNCAVPGTGSDENC